MFCYKGINLIVNRKNRTHCSRFVFQCFVFFSLAGVEIQSSCSGSEEKYTDPLQPLCISIPIRLQHLVWLKYFQPGRRLDILGRRGRRSKSTPPTPPGHSQKWLQWVPDPTAARISHPCLKYHLTVHRIRSADQILKSLKLSI